MVEKQIEEYRRQVSDALGAAVAAKATDAFCREFARASVTSKGASGNPPGIGPVVLELVREPPPPVPLREVVERVRASQGLADALEAIRAMIGAAADPASAQRLNAWVNPTALLREVFIKELRERCHRAARSVRDEVERATSDIPREALERAPDPEYCWLNQTIRTWYGPERLSALAPDPSITAIGIPVPLELEVSVSGCVVGATQYRQLNSRSGKGVVVAVIDERVDRGHPAFDDRVFGMGAFAQRDGGPRLHGTQVAGIIAARDAVHSGMAPDALVFNYTLYPRWQFDDFYAALALQKALEDGANIANCSWGTGNPTDGSSRLTYACDQAWACGMTIVKSVGNNGRITCPADAEGVIVVGATDRSGTQVLPNSSRGRTVSEKPCPDLVAPGGDASDEITTCTVGNDFDEAGNGWTSLAAAHVSGLLCLVLETAPDLTPAEQREHLLGFCRRLPESDVIAQGAGLISLINLRDCRAVAAHAPLSVVGEAM